jgi:PiT family inorganic phosphate transporter
VLGKGLATKGRKVRWPLALRVLVACLITLPIAGLIGAGAYGVERLFGGTVGSLVLVGLATVYLVTVFLRARRNAVSAATVDEPWKSEIEADLAHSA